MSTVSKAADVIDSALPVGSHITKSFSESAAKALADAGLLMPDLPQPDFNFTDGDARWVVIGKVAVDSWYDDGGPVVELRAGRGRYLIPAEARHLAYLLLAAANHAEAQANE